MSPRFWFEHLEDWSCHILSWKIPWEGQIYVAKGRSGPCLQSVEGSGKYFYGTTVYISNLT